VGGGAVHFGTIASLPLDLFKRDGEDRKAVGPNDPLGNIIKYTVNDDLLTSYQWRKSAMQDVLLYGRHFTFIERNAAGRVMNLWPLDPRKRRSGRKTGGRRQYIYTDGDSKVSYAGPEVIDLPWLLAADGLCHYNPVSLFKNAIGLAMALESYAARFFENGGIPPLALHGPMPTGAGVKRAAEDIQAGLARGAERAPQRPCAARRP
jgi:phage portal protein BeeE